MQTHLLKRRRTAVFATGVALALSVLTSAQPSQATDAPPAYVSQFGTAGSGDGQLIFPFVIAIDAAGNVFVSDVNNNRIQKFDSSGHYLSQFGTGGRGDGQLSSPFGIAIDSMGNIYVADTGNNRIQKFDSSGTYLTQFGGGGTGPGRFQSPTGMVVDHSGNVYVVDTGNNRIQKFDSSGHYLSQFGTMGPGDGQLLSPFGIAIDSMGNIFVADSYNFRIEEFDANGAYLSKFTYSGAGADQLFPFELAFDPAGNMYVADGGNDRVVKFDANGNYLTQFGGTGSDDGQFEYPNGIAIGPSGDIYVTDSFNDRIQRFAYPKPVASPVFFTPPPLKIGKVDNVSLIATSDTGAPASYIVPPTSTGTAICNPPNGTLLPVGTTQATCYVTDNYNQAASTSFSITVLPKLSIGSVDDVAAMADASGQANVMFTPPLSSQGTVTCDKHPGLFPVGANAVTCTATANEQTASTTFNITVLDPKG